MTSLNDRKKDRIAAYIDENLKQVFSELEQDAMPDKIMDLLTVLRAQDRAQKKEE